MMRWCFLAAFLGLCGWCAAAQSDPEVVFSEDFENFDPKNWSEIKKLGDTVEIVDGGRRGKCAQITATLGRDEGGHLYRVLREGLETCHLRFYVKFEKEHAYIHHFVTLCAYNPPTRWPQGGAGTRPQGHERFTTGIEPWGFWGKYPPPGAWHFYSYFCEMKPSRDGRYWGNSFAPDPPALVERDRWICVEIMVRCNDPDKADGEQALWLDGREIGRWTGIRWRRDARLKTNAVWMLYYITETAVKQNKVAEPRKVNRVWFDDIVVAKSYIGPAKDR